MQSIRRQIKRGNAVLALNAVTHGLQVVQKTGTEKDVWRNAILDRADASEQEYMDNITMPLTEQEIFESKDRHVFKRP
jgi:hypothetical protein